MKNKVLWAIAWIWIKFNFKLTGVGIYCIGLELEIFLREDIRNENH